MLSEPGAPVAEGTIPLSVPALRGNEWKYVKECLDSNWVSSAGPFVGRFERMVAGFVGTKYAVSTQNGTAALHVALLVAGIQPEDEVLVSTLTFIAPANAVRYCGAWPVLIDAEPTYWQMDPQRVIDFLERDCDCASGRLRNRATGRRVRAILPVHILGHPVDMDPILELAARYRLLVIEDASESLGVKYKGQMTGSLGDMACFSFNGNKIATTGGGGMIVTNNEEWARKARHLTTQAKVDEIEYVHDQVGYNYRLTNIQAALGCAQLEQLPGFISAKRHIAELYLDHLSRRPGIIPLKEPPW
jgi:perosamine synthetase